MHTMLLPSLWADILTIALLFLIISTAIAAVTMRNLLASSLCLGIFSLLMALTYLLMDAPDVAITEAAVGAGVSTVFLLAGLSIVGKDETAPRYSPWLALVMVMAIGGLLIYSTFGMPLYGSPVAPIHHHVANYYLSNTRHEIGIPSVVAAILASYRGFDTLGETTVVLTAALSIMMLLGKRRKSHA